MEQKRLDPRVRFQRAGFTKKLQAARSYKRVARVRSENRVEAGLQKVGLASLIMQLLFAAALIAVAYLLYVPNPLFVTKIEVEGLNNDNRTLAQQAVDEYQHSRPWYIPSANYLFFDPQKIAEAIAAKVPAVSKVTASEKTFKTKSAKIVVVEKYERYAVFRPQDELLLYNDGTIKKILSNTGEDLPQSGALVTVSVNHTAPVNITDQYLDPTLLSLVEDTANLFPQTTGQNYAYFEAKLPEGDPQTTQKFTESWKEGTLAAVLVKTATAGKTNPARFRVILEPGINITDTSAKLKLLLDQTPPDRYRGLVYVDMRLPTRAYLCVINTPCSN